MFNKYKYIYLTVIFYFIWLVGIPFGFRMVAQPVLNVLKTKAGINIELSNPRIRTSIIPNLKFTADNIKIIDDDSLPALEVTKPNINLRILPLISGRLHFNSLECDTISANAILKDKLYLAGFPLDINPNMPKPKIKRIKIRRFKFDICEVEPENSYKLTGSNFYFKNARNSFIVHGKTNCVFNGTSAFANFDIRLPHRKNLKKTKFSIDVENLNLEPFSDIVNRCLYDEITHLSGIINLNTDTRNMYGEFNNFRVEFKDKNKDIIFPDKLIAEAAYKIGENSFRIKDCTVYGNKLKASVKGYIKDIFSKTPYVNLKTNIAKSDLREGALMLPPIVTPDISIPKLKEYPFYGTIFGDIKIKGKFPEPNITGNIKVTDGVMIKPIPNSKSGANINIDFVGKKLTLDVVVPAGGREVVYVSGDVTLYGESFANLKIKSSNSVKLETAEFVLNPLHEILRFMIGPVPIMDVTGVGNVDLKIIGTKKDPHIWGDFNFKNANARFLEVNNLELKNADGNLNFNNQNAHFVNHTGTLHGKPATVDGVCTLFGDLDFDVKANGQNLDDLVKILTTSPMLSDIKPLVPKLTDIKGTTDFYLHLRGKLFDIADLKINENVIPSGFIKLYNNSAKFEGIAVNGIDGIINYNKKDCDFDLKSMISSASISTIKGSIKNNIADIKINSPRIKVNELEPNKLKYLDSLLIKLSAEYKGDVGKIDARGINAIVEVLRDNKPIKNSKILSGKITVKNGNLNITNLYGIIKRHQFNTNLTISNIGDKDGINLKKAKISGIFNCRELDLTALNLIIKSNIMPPEIQKELNRIEFLSGIANINAKIRNNKVNSAINIANAEISYLFNRSKETIKIPFKIKSGQLIINNSTANINKFYCFLDEMPLLAYGHIKNIYSNPQFNLRINSKFVQKTFDKYWNFNNIYPIKVKGDIISSVGIDGGLKNLKLRTDIKLEPNSSIYYMGATLGDSYNPVTINVDTNLDKTGWIKLNKFKYNKIISSQNKKNNILPLLSAKGMIKQNGKICLLKNLAVKTDNPVNADLFNIIFKKPTIKSGNFTSDLIINGSSNHPKILGKFYAKNIEMPYLNTSVKDINVDFKPDSIQLTTKGNVLDNYIMFNSNIKNNLNPPYKINSGDVYINSLDLNNTLNQIKQMELKGLSSAISPDTDIFSFKLLNSVLLNNIKVRAGNVKIKNINASNLEAVCNLNEKMNFSVDGLKFNMASGIMTGKIKYNLVNNFMQMELNSKGVNANELVIALFDLPNQIYGSLTGHIELNCNATDDKTRLTTLNGYGTFNVKNGRMPKLGSLEYLLKAGSFIKGGITGLSMNGVIDILKPMRTGEFSSIDGRIRIKDGIAKTIEIRTMGKGLSLYVIGTLNLYTQVADMHVYGQLSRKVSTILGAAGNISLNTLFNKIPWISADSNSGIINDLNKIPGIELSNKSFRRFMVEILGNINQDNFVKSFKWIN